MKNGVQERVKLIKQSFRHIMDGATAQSMREKGLDYRLNWGASLQMLRQQADELGQDYDLAIALWKEDIRECKILATMMMPPGEMLPDVADIWMEQMPTVEIAEQAAFNLFQHLPYAADKAFRWIADSGLLPQICGYHILSRLFARGQQPNERGINEFLDQALTALASESVTLRKAAMQSILRFAQLGLVYERIARSATKSRGFDFINTEIP